MVASLEARKYTRSILKWGSLVVWSNWVIADPWSVFAGWSRLSDIDCVECWYLIFWYQSGQVSAGWSQCWRPADRGWLVERAWLCVLQSEPAWWSDSVINLAPSKHSSVITTSRSHRWVTQPGSHYCQTQEKCKASHQGLDESPWAHL